MGKPASDRGLYSDEFSQLGPKTDAFSFTTSQGFIDLTAGLYYYKTHLPLLSPSPPI
jgi:hypothetical protein